MIMTTQEVANRLVDLCREGQHLRAIDELYDPNIVSIEPPGAPNQHTEGFKNVRAKSEYFTRIITRVHSNEVSDPMVSGNHFAIILKTDVTSSEFGRTAMEEMAVYGVKDGKIVWEHFYYDPGAR